MPTVVCQLWEESEAGWGCRPDGWTVHKTEIDRLVFVKDHQARQPKKVPSEYTRPCGSPFLMDIDGELCKKLRASKNGVWADPAKWPERSRHEDL